MSEETIMGRGHCGCGAEYDVWLQVDADRRAVQIQQPAWCPVCHHRPARVEADLCPFGVFCDHEHGGR